MSISLFAFQFSAVSLKCLVNMLFGSHDQYALMNTRCIVSELLQDFLFLLDIFSTKNDYIFNFFFSLSGMYYCIVNCGSLFVFFVFTVLHTFFVNAALVRNQKNTL